jgi:glycosyltransferase involved in cell wall biosynthesis
MGYQTSLLRFAGYTNTRKPGREVWSYACELPRLTHELQAIVERGGADLLYVNGPRLLPPAAWIAGQEKIPLAFHCHHLLQQSSAILLAGASLRLSGAYTIACCRFAVQPIEKYINPKKLFVRYNGVFGPKVSRPKRTGGLERVGVIGRVEPEKGQLEFVRAVRLLARQFPGCRFVIAGSPMFSSDKYYREVVNASQALPIEFVEWQNDVSELYENLDLLVVPSAPPEATTRVIFEAFAYGVPVVAFPSGGIPEIMRDNETGFLARGTTAEALAQRICSVLRMQPADLDAVRDAALQSWRANFTVEHYRKDICDILHEANAAGNGSSRSDLSPVYTNSATREQ